MPLEYYTLPLRLDAVLQKKEHPKCTLQKSVAQHLHLLFTTAFGEAAGDRDFGCAIWEHDFDNLTSGHKLKEMLRVSLLQSIAAHEKRLDNVRVELALRQEELQTGPGFRQAKKFIEVTVTGTLRLTNDRFRYTDSFFISPLSY